MKLLTVIIRVYNGETNIERSINSVIEQTYIDNIQILIINDGSTDNSLNICNEIKNKYPEILITIVSHKTNLGRGKGLNTAKKHIKGKYCCVLDCDDCYVSNTWVEELFNEIGNKRYSILYRNEYSFHWNYVYLSSVFKVCPIPNINFYEDHYVRWFFNNENLKKYLHHVENYYCYNSGHEGVNMEEYHANNKKFDDKYGLREIAYIYERVFYNKTENIDELIALCEGIDYNRLDKSLLESYNEICKELKIEK